MLRLFARFDAKRFHLFLKKSLFNSQLACRICLDSAALFKCVLEKLPFPRSNGLMKRQLQQLNQITWYIAFWWSRNGLMQD